MADLARLDELRRQYAAHPRRYFAPLASALRRAGDPRAAVEVARAGLAEAPEHLTGHVILGQALADAGDRTGARLAFESAHAVDEGNVVALEALVGIAHDDGDEAAAARWAALLREADPEPESAAHASAATAEAEPAGFELLDYTEIEPPRAPADDPAPPAAAPAETLDPVVGLDLAPADPLPAPMRDALPELLDEAERERATVSDVDAPAVTAEDGVAAPPPAAPFVTETMANLLAAQGHTAQALDVYAQLLAQRPGDERLLARVAALRGTDAGAPEPAAEDERAARMWRAALAPLPAEDPDLDDLSFDRFFADAPEPEPAVPVGDFERWAAEVDRAPAATAPPAPQRPAAALPPDDPDADLAAFNAWLRSLDA